MAKKNSFNSISLIYNFNKKSKLDFYSLINSSNQSLDINRVQKFYTENDDLLISFGIELLALVPLVG